MSRPRVHSSRKTIQFYLWGMSVRQCREDLLSGDHLNRLMGIPRRRVEGLWRGSARREGALLYRSIARTKDGSREGGHAALVNSSSKHRSDEAWLLSPPRSRAEGHFPARNPAEQRRQSSFRFAASASPATSSRWPVL